jgi:hypothetical protein
LSKRKRKNRRKEEGRRKLTQMTKSEREAKHGHLKQAKPTKAKRSLKTSQMLVPLDSGKGSTQLTSDENQSSSKCQTSLNSP